MQRMLLPGRRRDPISTNSFPGTLDRQAGTRSSPMILRARYAQSGTDCTLARATVGHADGCRGHGMCGTMLDYGLCE